MADSIATSSLVATPTRDALPRRFGDFALLGDALAYAGQGERGLNFHDARGTLRHVLSYADLHANAQRTARQLTGLGLKPGDRIALIAETAPEFVTLFFAASLTGILPVPLPLPTSFGGKEGYILQLRNLLASCDPSLLIGSAPMLAILKEAAHGTSVTAMDWLQVAALPAPDVTLPQLRPDDICYLQYSSGSTRFPHGIAVTHRSLLDNCRGQGLYGVDLREDDRGISWLPFYHDMGLVGCLLTAIVCQFSCDFLATDDFARRPMTWLKMISANPDHTVSYSPTFGFDITTRRVGPEALKELDLSRWRVAGNGGDMIRPDVMQAFVTTFAAAGYRPTSFVPSYGLAECTLAVSFMPLGRGIETDLVDERALKGLPPLEDPMEPRRFRAIVNCGKPLPGFEVEVRGEHGNRLAERHIGKLFVRGAAVMQGYFRDEETTRSVLSADGWLDTGDMAYMSDGCIFIVGRAKDMIIINGRNHWPQDIEWAVEQMPGLRNGDIAAFAITDDRGEELPAVLVQCRISDLEERMALKAEVTARVKQITGMNCLVELVPPRSLPKTSSGKLSRSKARTMFLSGALQSVDMGESASA